MSDSPFPDGLLWAAVAGGDPYVLEIVHQQDSTSFTLAEHIPEHLALDSIHVLVQSVQNAVEVLIIRRSRGTMRLWESAVQLRLAARMAAPAELKWNDSLTVIAEDLGAWEAARLPARQLVERTLDHLAIGRSSESHPRLFMLPAPPLLTHWQQPVSQRSYWIVCALFAIYLNQPRHPRREIDVSLLRNLSKVVT